MERAGRLLSTLEAAQRALPREQLAAAAWSAAVGRRLARRTRPAGMVRDRLVVEVEDELWRRNLHALRGQVLSNLAELLGESAPREVEFRVATPRRPVQSETAARPAAPLDEADRIADPVLSYIYRQSRRKAGA
jgi:predicted nucleic acid-binding Zn ribbon protein